VPQVGWTIVHVVLVALLVGVGLPFAAALALRGDKTLQNLTQL
jgi:hypothetical protein